jgi:hypothetical protein
MPRVTYYRLQPFKFSRSRGGKSADVTRFPSGPMKKGSILWAWSEKV